jgi:hypothetical protein
VGAYLGRDIVDAGARRDVDGDAVGGQLDGDAFADALAGTGDEGDSVIGFD